MNRKGENNPNWKGGISKNPETRRILANLSNRKYYKKNKDKINKEKVQYNKKWRHEHPKLAKKRDRKYHLMSNYGLTEEQLIQMLSQQNNKCAICDTKFFGKEPFIDHNHKTMKIRGLLCQKCNQAIGLFSENISVIKSAIEYLEKYTNKEE